MNEKDILKAIKLIGGLILIYLFVKIYNENRQKEIEHRYRMVYGAAMTEDMQAVEDYILRDGDKNTALLVDIIEELQKDFKNVE